MTTDQIRADLKKLASEIEALAQKVQVKIDSDKVVLDASNELVKDSLKLTFALGQLYGTNQKIVHRTRAVRSNANYHNVRDSRGRFTRK